ncbi:MAG TPA: hypothetical protein VMD02_05675 [Candidatus Omnitrophota bacterium]|nr:hypothetical protein [Candidatus Omnitrophota bacterium]
MISWLFWSFIILLPVSSLAANVDVKLDSADGSTGMIIRNSAGSAVATVDSWGRVRSNCTGGSAVTGSSPSNNTSGVLGGSTYGVLGLSTATSESGIQGIATGTLGVGIYGYASNFSGLNYGVEGMTNSSNGYAFFGVGGKNYFQGSVGIGTTAPSSTLEVNGDVKLAGLSSTPPAAAGKIYYSNASNRLNYYDGSKWIEVDPAYTTSTIETWLGTDTGTAWPVTDLFTVTIPELSSANGIIITSFSGMIDGTDGNFQGYFKDDSNNYAYFCVGHATPNGEYYVPFNVTFPIPRKFKGSSNTLTLYLAPVSGGTLYYKSFSIQYIPLPM